MTKHDMNKMKIKFSTIVSIVNNITSLNDNKILQIIKQMSQTETVLGIIMGVPNFFRHISLTFHADL